MRTDSVRKERSLGYAAHAAHAAQTATGVGGGYQLIAGRELPPLPLEDDEAVAVAVGLRAAAAGPVRELIKRRRRVADRLGRVAASSC
ncbi:hypothetical protein [Sorangium sp. So ce1099]|uniref:hypothetical protein n=1 Tax=Sorangium sp. So ce1099 TaxID=3133331 RepID=UPI003F6002AE